MDVASASVTDLLAEPGYRAWATASLVVVLKMMAVGVWTSALRVRASRFASPEDYAGQGLEATDARDPDVERARRIHRNDLENGLPFFVAGFCYAATGPSSLALAICFVGFPVARILHSYFYARAMMPHRTVAYGVGFFITLWMSLAALVYLLV